MNVMVDGETSQTRVVSAPVSSTNIFLRTALDFIRNKGLCSYSEDGNNWTALGGEFDLKFDWRTGTFQGEQLAIFCFNPQPGDGFVDVDWFELQTSRD
jgi:hypothetical protein